MKKVRLVIGLLAGMSSMASLEGTATGLVPEFCNIDEKELISYPIQYIGFSFDGAIEVEENIKAIIYSDGKPVEAGVLECENFVGSKRTQGRANIIFEPEISLPKGRMYKLVVPEGVIFKEGNHGISNDELAVEFGVPGSLGETWPTIKEGSIIEKIDRIGFNFGFETAPVENRKAILYREGVPVREYECEVSWDWNIGYAGIEMWKDAGWQSTTNCKFEKGVTYTVRIPEGCVSARLRPDIVNEDMEVSFIGGSEEQFKPIKYISCGRSDCGSDHILGKVEFVYDVPVALSLNPVVQLYNTADRIVVKEIVPEFEEKAGEWVIVADFQSIKLESGKEYSIVIPESTVVSTDVDIVVNQREELSVRNLQNISGIGGVEISGYTVRTNDREILLESVAEGATICLMMVNGTIIHSLKAVEERVALPILDSGIYILAIDGRTHKIIMK